MSEPKGEPQAADVRSFLPRPGEPVEEYAARLRALHHDLTLVLDAVERGLAAAEQAPAPKLETIPAAPEPVGAFAEPLHEPHRSPPPLGPLSASRGGARVEVVTAGREQARSGPPEPGGTTPWGGRPAPMGERAPDRGDPAALSPERPPWVESPPHPPRQGRWVEDEGWDAPPWTERRPSAWPSPPPPPMEMSFEPPYGAPRRRHRRAPALSPLLIAATVLGWLTVLALVLALALD